MNYNRNLLNQLVKVYQGLYYSIISTKQSCAPHKLCYSNRLTDTHIYCMTLYVCACMCVHACIYTYMHTCTQIHTVDAKVDIIHWSWCYTVLSLSSGDGCRLVDQQYSPIDEVMSTFRCPVPIHWTFLIIQIWRKEFNSLLHFLTSPLAVKAN